MSTHGIMRSVGIKPPARNLSARHVDRSRWYDPDFAPLNRPLAVQAQDALGPYTLPMRCVRTASGWISNHTKTPLHVTVIGWRYGESGVRG